jgi:hypothetical protein
LTAPAPRRPEHRADEKYNGHRQAAPRNSAVKISCRCRLLRASSGQCLFTKERKSRNPWHATQTRMQTRPYLRHIGPAYGLISLALGACGARTGLSLPEPGESGAASASPTAVLDERQVLPETAWGPGVERFTCLEPPPSFIRYPCQTDDECCYHSCVHSFNLLGEEYTQCYSLGPPNAPCGADENCAGLCSRQCASNDAGCRGVCGLSFPGGWCRKDADCMIPPCLIPALGISGSGFCFSCADDADCPGSRCTEGLCDSWAPMIRDAKEMSRP